jgi:hypothetical protein
VLGAANTGGGTRAIPAGYHPAMSLSGPVTAALVDRLSPLSHSDIGQALRAADLAKYDPGNVVNRTLRASAALDGAAKKDADADRKILNLAEALLQPARNPDAG